MSTMQHLCRSLFFFFFFFGACFPVVLPCTGLTGRSVWSLRIQAPAPAAAAIAAAIAAAEALASKVAIGG